MSVLVDQADLSLKYTAHYNEVKDDLFQGSSDILNAPRNKAFQDFVAQGIPTRKSENYKYTNLHPSFTPEFQFLHTKQEKETDAEEVFRCDVPNLNTNLAFLLNGWFKQDKDFELPEGVVFGSLDVISKEKPGVAESLRKSLPKPMKTQWLR